ncbi:MAG TPA: NAD-dependent succinate-semialdehyde dehydrogenase [Solirubrobacteraceae bacterium]|jgi:succinate-semialdehyde dehydrogenase/glutarate-semialdehyde dehydrogenase|nr:NAD-dependent succinate-semialdehyde dehydrogenase [Solirubrobacteraceae bacterium]
MSATTDRSKDPIVTTPPARIAMFIDGVWTGGTSGRTEPIIDPATGQSLGEVPIAAREDLDRAVEAASRSFPAWRDTPVDERGAILHRAADLIRERLSRIAWIMTTEEGKLLSQSTAEVIRVAKGIDWDAEDARRLYGRIIPVDHDTEMSVIHQPVGPVAAFTPWNFPAASPMRKLGGALSAGCTIVLKASEETPGTACALVQCFEEAGVPAGVINLVFGVPAEVSQHLITSPAIRMVAFTGSIPVGKRLAQLAGEHMKPSIMELGGHAPVVICRDADPERAGKAVAAAKYVNAGQVCTSPSRIYAHADIYDAFLDSYSGESRSLRVGNGLDESSQMGPMANTRRLAAMDELLEDAQERGTSVICGGSRIDQPGFFYEPTVLTEVPTEARIMREEPFGPVSAVLRFDDLNDALAAANSLPYGLAAYGFTGSADTADVLKRGLEAGIISINHCGGSVPEAPSGGVKDSGWGREGGSEGLDGYLITKRISHKLR